MAKLEFGRLILQDLCGDAGGTLGLGPNNPNYQLAHTDYFNYSEAESTTREPSTTTKEWIHLMTVLTKYESLVATDLFPFHRYTNMLDIGGNSGEFAARICSSTRHQLGATVFDLPQVVRFGERHLSDRPEAINIKFQAGNAFIDAIPAEFDLVSLKSMLHDWPDNEASHLLERAWHALAPGGTLLIFERSLQPPGLEIPRRFSSLIMLTWGHIFPGPDRYCKQLDSLGAEDVYVDEFELDLPWVLITANKPR